MKKIAIVRRNGLGDLICTFPLISLARKKYPNSKIFLFVDQKNAQLIPFLPPVDRVIVFPEKGSKYIYLLKIALRFRKEKFDLAISAKTSPMKLMNFFLRCLGAKIRAAYVSDQWHSRWINRPLSYDPLEKGHQALKNLRHLNPELSFIPKEHFPVAHVPDFFLQKYSPPESDLPVLVISATTTRYGNRISEGHYAKFLNTLHSMFPFSLWILTQEEDLERAKAISSHLKFPSVVQNPRNFEEFMVWLNGADYYFVGDGGTAHICAALGKKGVVLFGDSSTPEEWAPLSDRCVCLYHPFHVDLIDEKSVINSLKTMCCI